MSVRTTGELVVAGVSPAKLPDGGRFIVLDNLRGVAAMMVVAFHFGAYVPLGPFIQRSWVFVDFFFVLSGFVIAAAYGQRLASGFSLGRFAILRAGRIYPVHLTVLVGTIAVATGFELLNRWGAGLEVDADLPRSLPTLLLTIPLLQTLVNPAPTIWNPQSWSVSVELILYTVFGFAWSSTGRLGWAIGPAAGFFALAVLAWGRVDYSGLVNIDIVRGVAGFGLGIGCWLVHEWWRTHGTDKWSRVATFYEIAAVVLVVVVVMLQVSDPRIALADVVFAGALLVFAREGGAVSSLLQGRLFVGLGVISYSLYMVHPLVMYTFVTPLRRLGESPSMAAYAAAAKAPPTHFGLHAIVYYASALAVVMTVMAVIFGLAYASWRYVEAPAREWSRQKARAWGVARAERSAPTF